MSACWLMRIVIELCFIYKHPHLLGTYIILFTTTLCIWQLNQIASEILVLFLWLLPIGHAPSASSLPICPSFLSRQERPISWAFSSNVGGSYKLFVSISIKVDSCHHFSFRRKELLKVFTTMHFVVFFCVFLFYPFFILQNSLEFPFSVMFNPL